MHARELTPGCWVNTRAGRQVDYLAPDPDEITLSEMAAGLGRIERFLGATSHSYYVAEHALWCSYVVPEPFALLALHHDSAEYLTGDIPAPFKEAVKLHSGLADPIRLIEDILFRAITRSPNVAPLGVHWKAWRQAAGILGLDERKMPFVVKTADQMALAIERRYLCVARPAVVARWVSKPEDAAIRELPRLEPLGSATASDFWLGRHVKLAANSAGIALPMLVDQMVEAARELVDLTIGEQAKLLAERASGRIWRCLTAKGREQTDRLDLARATMATYPEEAGALGIDGLLPFAEPGLTPHAVLMAARVVAP